MLATDMEIAPRHIDARSAQLWAQWRTSPSTELRTALFLHYSPWLRSVASTLLTRYRYVLAEWADYVHCASIGLLQAIDNFDSTLNIPFEAYAYPRVKGATLNGLAVFLSESGKNTDPEEAATHFASRLDDDYEDDDPLVSVLDAVVDLALGRFLELGVAIEEELLNSPESYLEQEVGVHILYDLLEQLPERERFVLTSHYLHQMSFQLIADTLQISAPRVSQLHHQALRRLRQLFEEETSG